MNAPALVTLYVTFPDAEEATRVSRIVVDEALAACANILGPIQSIYRWEGVREETAEVAVLFKTTAAQAEAATARIAALHSYDVPCITAWPVSSAFLPYAQWVSASTDKG